MAKYRDWTGQLIDANLDSGSKRAKCRTIKSIGPLQCGERPSNAASSGSSIRDRASHCARADAGANTAWCNSEEKELNCRLRAREAEIRAPNPRLMFDVTKFRASG